MKHKNNKIAERLIKEIGDLSKVCNKLLSEIDSKNNEISSSDVNDIKNCKSALDRVYLSLMHLR
ncbi:TPA: hypothetical protein R1765_001943 [Campylobacter coli]|nr:hypothetical protein [Campylobacter coli]